MSATEIAAPSPSTACCTTGTSVAGFPAATSAPGQSTLRYRIGTYGSFYEHMLGRLPLLDLAPPGAPAQRPLARLTTRDPAEPTLALLDAWACALDVLTFYQERIANEGFLRTATERFSVRELAREVGFDLPPGLAASADLVFTVDDAVGSPRRATVEPGTKIMSIPGQNEKPQIFETGEATEVRAEWNELHPARLVNEPVLDAIEKGRTDLYLNGSTLLLTRGDALLFVSEPWRPGDLSWELRLIDGAESVRSTEATRVSWVGALARTDLARCFVLRQRAAVFGHNAPDWRTLPAEVRARFQTSDEQSPDPPGFEFPTPAAGRLALALDNVYPKLVPGSWLTLLSPLGASLLFEVDVTRVVAVAQFALSARVTSVEMPVASSDVANLAKLGIRSTTVWTQSEPLALGKRPSPSEPPPELPRTEGSELERRTLELLEPVAGLDAGRRLLLTGRRVRVRANVTAGDIRRDELFILLEPVQVLEVPVAAAGGAAAVRRRLRWLLQRPTGEQLEYLGPEQLVTLPAPNADPPPGADEFTRLASAPEDAPVAETARLDSALAASGSLPARLILEQVPRFQYDRDSLRIFANVVLATHGETVADEVLGSGTGAPDLAFTLKRPPLTHVASTDAAGTASTLSVEVNNVRWHEVPSLFDVGPRERCYTVRLDEGGQATVSFGDGKSGARPPSGVENLVASYRSGIGVEGMVKANSLALLLTQPIGVRAVTNPLPAFDGVAPASLEQARSLTPLDVRATGRAVSVEDVEDFARPFAGVGNARATLLRTRSGPVAVLTVAAANGDPVAPDSPLLDTLRRAIAQAADPALRFVVDTYDPVPFELEVQVLVDADYEPAAVLAAARGVLSDAFAVNARPFGGLITEAEIIAAVMGVTGVLTAKVVQLREQGGLDPSRQTALRALPARLVNDSIQRARALVFAFGHPLLTAMPP